MHLDLGSAPLGWQILQFSILHYYLSTTNAHNLNITTLHQFFSDSRPLVENFIQVYAA